jgi:hypothetical protein
MTILFTKLMPLSQLAFVMMCIAGLNKVIQ